VSKPPLQKRKSEAVIEILRKQEKIRKNFDNRRSFNDSSSRNSKNNSNYKDRRSFKISQDKLLNHRGTNKSTVTVAKKEKEHKKLKPSQITRKEARARIGLGDIPDEKIEELVKIKKSKLNHTSPKNIEKVVTAVSDFKVPEKVKSRAIVNQKLKNSKSTDKGSSIIVLKEPIKIKFPEPKMHTKPASPHYEMELNSSLGEISEFMPIYKPAVIKSHQKAAKNVVKTIELSHQESEEKKELIKAQRKAKARKLREEREKERMEEERKKKGLDRLNEMFKKRTQGFKNKCKEETENDNLIVPTNTSIPVCQDSYKLHPSISSKLPINSKTTKTSYTNSIPHSIQSPLSKQPHLPSNRRSYNSKAVK
jgi:hypothetical protein